MRLLEKRGGVRRRIPLLTGDREIHTRLGQHVLGGGLTLQGPVVTARDMVNECGLAQTGELTGIPLPVDEHESSEQIGLFTGQNQVDHAPHRLPGSVDAGGINGVLALKPCDEAAGEVEPIGRRVTVMVVQNRLGVGGHHHNAGVGRLRDAARPNERAVLRQRSGGVVGYGAGVCDVVHQWIGARAGIPLG